MQTSIFKNDPDSDSVYNTIDLASEEPNQEERMVVNDAAEKIIVYLAKGNLDNAEKLSSVIIADEAPRYQDVYECVGYDEGDAIMVLALFFGESYKDLAEGFDILEGTVKSRIHRARKDVT